ncbi:MAG: hypothetical protein WCJ09_27820 [Planctomycetota bacterium]
MESNSGSKGQPAKRTTVEVTLDGRVFPFELWHRPLQLGEVGEIQYYWMNSSELRKGLQATDEELANLRNCIGLWWRAAKGSGANREESQIKHLLLASCYGLFANNKALQMVFHDAYLKRETWSNHESAELVLPVPATQVDRNSIATSIRGLLSDTQLSTDEVKFIRAVLNVILGWGVRGFRRNPEQGTQDFVNQIHSWSESVRRRAGHSWRRLCLNQFAYSSKVSFYRCYANAWVHILPVLQRRGLDELSSRFLRFWHWQNQPIAHDDGRVESDVFGGQILALHPVSGNLMDDRGFMTVAGAFLTHTTHDENDTGTYADRQEYHDFVQGILLGLQQYANERNQQAENRHTANNNSVLLRASVPAGTSEDVVAQITEFLKNAENRCKACSGDLECQAVENLASCVASVSTRCRRCHQESHAEISLELLAQFFMRE